MTTPGEEIWNALEPGVAAQYPTPRVILFQAEAEPDAGGPPLARVVAFAAEEPSPHWFVITCGLSLSRLRPDYVDVGGFELTLRLARPKGETAPPAWVAATLQRLARMAFRSSRPVKVGESLTLGAGWAEPETLTSLTEGHFVEDARIAKGEVPLVQLIATTKQATARMKTSGLSRSEFLFKLLPHGILDLPAARAEPEPEDAPGSPATRTRAAAPPPRPAPPPMPTLASVSVQKLNGKMRLSVGRQESHPFADALLSTVLAGRLTFQSQGWTVHLTTEEAARSATWATTLAIFCTPQLTERVAADLKDSSRHGAPLQWKELPDLEIVVV